MNSPDVCKAIIKFFKQIFKSLKQQIGMETAKDTISLFVQVPFCASIFILTNKHCFCVAYFSFFRSSKSSILSK